MFKDIVRKFRNKKVLVIGDIMLDHYILGDVNRISPEAPVPVVHVKKDTFSAGGAANVAFNLSNLGVQTSIMGFLGKDENGETLAKMFADNGISLFNTSNFTPFTAPTIIKTRVLVRGQQLCRIDREHHPLAYEIRLEGAAEDWIRSMMNNYDSIILSDYAKGVVSQRLIDFIITHKNNNLFLAMDPKPKRKLTLRYLDLLTPNKGEAYQLVGMDPDEKVQGTSLEDVVKLIHEKFQPSYLVVTLGAEGMAICKGGKVEKIIPTIAKEVFDVSGAGDTVIATLCTGLITGLSLEEAAKLSNAAAGIVVGHSGTCPINLNELLNYFS